MKNVLLSLAFCQIFGYGERCSEVYAHYNGDLERFFAQREILIQRDRFLLPRERSALKGINFKTLEQQIIACKEEGIEVIHYSKKDFSVSRGNIMPAPMALYCKGDLTLLDEKKLIAVTGTKKPSSYGGMVTEKLVRELSLLGFRSVIQWTQGLNELAIETALPYLPPIILLPQGVQYSLKQKKSSLITQVLEEGGLLLSPFDRNMGMTAHGFNILGEIQSGIAEGLLVTQAPENSGTLRAASSALKKGQKLFVVPGNILGSQYRGSNRLINQGGMLAESGAYMAYTLGMNGEEISKRMKEAGRAYEMIRQPMIGDKKGNKPKNIPAVGDAQSIEMDKNVEKSSKEDARKRKSCKVSFETPLQEKIYALLVEKPLTLDQLYENIDEEIGEVVASVIELESLGVIRLNVQNSCYLVDFK